ncbi:unnamed protein product [Medioppia subpectinata]|uniref:Peptidase S1 domain-containing protein n=1 Tax=Medioppia subpectinata TaxID=1979941 RepID=A0A7R9L0P5_9ACAR|nr:unnamed protein product [Medioppia subpectinata]CAG2113059.1 unnamed protein product [Medioppia subpectinata]
MCTQGAQYVFSFLPLVCGTNELEIKTTHSRPVGEVADDVDARHERHRESNSHIKLMVCAYEIQLIANHTDNDGAGSDGFIQHYPNVTDSDCGVGRESMLMDNQCFKYHKTHASSPIMNGRNATAGEMPFTALIVSFSTNITTNITCNSTDYICPHTTKAFVGLKGLNDFPNPNNPNAPRIPGYDVVDIHIFPLFKPGLFYHDIALIRVQPDIAFTDRLAVNTVCLPKPGVENSDSEYALISGWGVTDTNGSIDEIMFGRPMAWVKILAPNAAICKGDSGGPLVQYVSGDSGGPLVQYVSGRAVLIGVAKGIVSMDNSTDAQQLICAKADQKVFMGAQYVFSFLPLVCGTNELVIKTTHSRPVGEVAEDVDARHERHRESNSHIKLMVCAYEIQLIANHTHNDGAGSDGCNHNETNCESN